MKLRGSSSLFVGRTDGEMASASDGTMCEGLQDTNGALNHDGLGCIHAMHLPGLGSELLITDCTFANYEAAVSELTGGSARECIRRFGRFFLGRARGEGDSEV